MKASVWKVGIWRPSKWEDGNNLVIVFKGIGKDDFGVTYKLNLNSLDPRKEAWLRVAKEGNVCDGLNLVRGTKNISRYTVPTVHKPTVHGREAVDEDGNLPGQMELPLHEPQESN